MRRTLLLLLAIFVCLFATGCLRRTLAITSEPPGALLWLNGREIGRTPADVDFLFYGTYDVVLEADGYEPLITKGDAVAPWWDNVPFDLVSEVAAGNQHVIVPLHYVLQPRKDDRQLLLQRARDLRQMIPPRASQPQTAPTTEPASQPGE